MSECACQQIIDEIKHAAREAVMRDLMRQVSELERQRDKMVETIENLVLQINLLEQQHGKCTDT